MKLPFIKFYPSDWLSDERLRVVSLAARGLWFDMLCLMAKAGRRGYLEVSEGVAMDLESLARIAGITVIECRKLVGILEKNSVFSRSKTGIIYSRRMVRDDAILRKCSEAGARGGNPLLKKEGQGGLTPPLTLPLTPEGVEGLRGGLRPPLTLDARSQKQYAEGQGPRRKRNDLFDHLVRLSGGNPDGVTKSEAGAIGKALSQIRGATPDLTLAELDRRTANYRLRFPGATITGPALAKHWSAIDQPPQVQGATNAAAQPDKAVRIV